MDDTQLLVDIGDIELVLLSVGGVLFLTVYTLLARWWETREGRFVFIASVWLTALFSYVYALRLGWLGHLDDDAFRAWIRVVILTGFGAALAWICVLLVMAQLDSWRERNAAKRRPRSDDR